MRELTQSTATTVMVFLADSTDHVAGKTGLTPTVQASKAGAAFATITPTATTERGSGWYAVGLSTSHTDTLGDLAFHVTATGADPADFVCRVIKTDKTLAVQPANVTQVAGQTANASAAVTFPSSIGTSTYAGGAVASVTGAVGSVAGNVGGNVAGSVGSVTGNVGGNVVGSVGSVSSPVTAGTVSDKTGYSLDAAQRVKLDAAQPDYAPATATDVTDARDHVEAHGDGAWATATGFSTLDATDVQDAAEAALAAFDPPTRTEAASDRDAILTAVGTPLQGGDYTSPDNAGIAAIQAKTDNLPDDPAGVSDLPSVAGLSTFDPTTDPVTLAADQSAVEAIGGVDVTGATVPASGDWTTGDDLPANFAALGINEDGHVSRVTLVDTTTTNADMRGTDGASTTTPPTAAAIADAVHTREPRTTGEGFNPTAISLETMIADQAGPSARVGPDQVTYEADGSTAKRSRPVATSGGLVAGLGPGEAP